MRRGAGLPPTRLESQREAQSGYRSDIAICFDLGNKGCTDLCASGFVQIAHLGSENGTVLGKDGEFCCSN